MVIYLINQPVYLHLLIEYAVVAGVGFLVRDDGRDEGLDLISFGSAI